MVHSVPDPKLLMLCMSCSNHTWQSHSRRQRKKWPLSNRKCSPLPTYCQLHTITLGNICSLNVTTEFLFCHIQPHTFQTESVLVYLFYKFGGEIVSTSPYLMCFANEIFSSHSSELMKTINIDKINYSKAHIMVKIFFYLINILHV